jgi:lipoprotein-anchoring transpeptidase ErfK/SrfK
MAYYPTWADDAVDRQLGPNTWLTLTGQVDAADGTTWYQTQGGDYVPADAVFVPDRSDAFTGHWLDVNLTSPARITAYEGDTPVNAFLTIKGAGPRPTPTGVFTILRRVANETMNSDTIGIPRNGPGGYYLTNVLFTQYFTNDGASLHYNYWSSMWGYAGSHGCLGLTYQDSAWLWGWAHIGTPLVIHY